MIDNVKTYTQQLNTLCELLHAHHYKKVEEMLLEIVHNAIKTQLHTDKQFGELEFITDIYSNFNTQFEVWLEGKKFSYTDIKRKIGGLMSPNHTNMCIARCVDPISMDDIFYTTIQYLTGNGKKSELVERLNNYKSTYLL